MQSTYRIPASQRSRPNCNKKGYLGDQSRVRLSVWFWPAFWRSCPPPHSLTVEVEEVEEVVVMVEEAVALVVVVMVEEALALVVVAMVAGLVVAEAILAAAALVVAEGLLAVGGFLGGGGRFPAGGVVVG